MSKRISIFPKRKHQYKVNLHAHTNVSDGKFSPEEVKAIYQAEGYSAVAFTDHRKCVPHPELTDDSFVALTGVELDFWETEETGALSKAIHINAISCDPGLTYTMERNVPTTPNVFMDFDRANAMVKELKDKGCYIILNHPVWSGMSNEDVEKVRHFDAMEVRNSVAVRYFGSADDSAHYHSYLRSGNRIAPVAADDCHYKREDGSAGDEFCNGFVYVLANELSYASLMQAIQKGHYYASTGPRFEDIYLEGDILHVVCSPVSDVFVLERSITRKERITARTDSITHARIDISRIKAYSPFVWVTLRDSAGRQAWSVPYWF